MSWLQLWVLMITFKGTSLSMHVYLKGRRDQDIKTWNQRFCFKMPSWFYIKFRTWVLKVTAGPNVQNTIKCHTSPVMYCSFCVIWPWAVQALAMCVESNGCTENRFHSLNPVFIGGYHHVVLERFHLHGLKRKKKKRKGSTLKVLFCQWISNGRWSVWSVGIKLNLTS